MKIEVVPASRLRLFLDLNETLIRTGEVSPAERLRETAELGEFVTRIDKLAASLNGVEVVFLTGNSFEYSRRIEEPLGLKNIPDTSVVIVSENGLIGRSFHEGDLWRLEPTADYHQCMRDFERALHGTKQLHGRFYTQGNEVRRTLKPVANAFTERESRLLGKIAGETVPQSVGRVFLHRYYLDIDPVRVTENNCETNFGGKSFAVVRLVARAEATNLAVGDSASDVPMFEAVNATGGHSFWVANAEPPSDYEGACSLNGDFTAGVNELLAQIKIKPAIS